jgi:hypothetical protein
VDLASELIMDLAEILLSSSNKLGPSRGFIDNIADLICVRALSKRTIIIELDYSLALGIKSYSLGHTPP